MSMRRVMITLDTDALNYQVLEEIRYAVTDSLKAILKLTHHCHIEVRSCSQFVEHDEE